MPVAILTVVDGDKAGRFVCPFQPDGCRGPQCMLWADMVPAEPTTGEPAVGACALAVGALNIRPGG